MLISFMFSVLALAISPGPDNIFVLIQSLSYGKKYGLAVVFGLMTGCLVHTSLVAFGVSYLIVENETLFTLLKIFGVLYLLFLAYKVYRSDAKISIEKQSEKPKSLSALFRQGFLMNVLNPKVSLFFLALFPGFLFSESLSETYQFFILGLLFIAVSFLVFGSIALFSGYFSSFIFKNKNAGKILKGLQVIVFVTIAIYILLT